MMGRTTTGEPSQPSGQAQNKSERAFRYLHVPFCSGCDMLGAAAARRVGKPTDAAKLYACIRGDLSNDFCYSAVH